MKARLLLIAVVAFAAMAFSGSVCAQVIDLHTFIEEIREGMQSENPESEYVRLFPEVKKIAGQGDAEAQMVLGAMYLAGIGTSQNYAEAFKWTKLSAGQGNCTAQCIIGMMYELGVGVSKNHFEALKWIKLSADQGEPSAKNLYEVLSSTVSAPSTPATSSSTRTSGTAAGSSTRTSGTTPPASERTSGTTAAPPASRASATGSSSSNTSGYSSYSSGGSSSYYSYKRPFNTLDEIHPVGISVGYVQKYWSFESESGPSGIQTEFL